jgi:hypothetical protein
LEDEILFDVEALLRAVLIGVGTGCVTGAILFFVTRPNPARRLAVLITGSCGIGLLAAVGVYYALPTRTAVPVLDNLSQIEAQDVLAKKKLIASPRPQYGRGIVAGRVIPDSQVPAAGLVVARGTVVTFGVSQQLASGGSQPQNPARSHTVDVRLFEPRDGQALRCSHGVGNITRCEVSGVVSGADGVAPLLWIQPVDPPTESPGWYLQRPPGNGVKGIENDGRWTGIVQIGNAQYPAKDGYKVNVAVSIVDEAEANRLMGESGVVVRDQPSGSVVRIASNVVVASK